MKEISSDIEVIHLGCRLNSFESDVIRQLSLPNIGKKRVIVNTCAVTNSAAKQSMRTVLKMRKKYPDAEICVTGCAVQLKPEKYIAVADRVLGNLDKIKAESYTGEKFKVTDIKLAKEIKSEDLPVIKDFKNNTRASIEIQNGCDHHCTFCTIPLARGKNRSNNSQKIIDQISLFVSSNYNEVTLTGVDITNYGTDIGTSFSALISEIMSSVPSLPRLRLSSIDVSEIDNEFIRLFATEKRIMPHIHMSLQSGDDTILRRMGRRHNCNQATALCEIIRSLRKDTVFGADIIVGFPTETEEMFHNSLNLLEALDISFIHVFPFSSNEGAAAAKLPQLSKKTISARAIIARQFADKRRHVLLESMVGTKQKVLIENQYGGKAENYVDIKLKNPTNIPIGNILECHIESHDDKSLIGTLV